jgi:hypothetical protein
LNVEQVERVEAELYAFVEKRARERNEANKLSELWEASERAHHEKRRQENQAGWYSFHFHMHQLHASLSEQHRVKAEALLEELGGRG